MIYYYYRRELVDAINAAAKSASLLKFKSEMEEQSKLTQVVMHMGYEMFGKFQNDLLKKWPTPIFF